MKRMGGDILLCDAPDGHPAAVPVDRYQWWDSRHVTNLQSHLVMRKHILHRGRKEFLLRATSSLMNTLPWDSNQGSPKVPTLDK